MKVFRLCFYQAPWKIKEEKIRLVCCACYIRRAKYESVEGMLFGACEMTIFQILTTIVFSGGDYTSG